VVGSNEYLISPEGTVVWDSVPVAASPDFLSGAATDQLLVAALGLRVLVHDASTRAVLWESQEAPFASWLVPPTITADARLLVKRTADTLFVFEAVSGQMLRLFQDPDTSVDKRVFGVGPVPVGDRYYLPTVSRLAAYDTAGPLKWLSQFGATGMTEPAIALDGSLYVQTRVFGLWALNPDGSTKWFRRTPNNNEGWREQARWPWHGGPALAQGGVLYTAGQAAFFAHDQDGQPLWEFVVDSAGSPQAFIGSPAIAPDGTVYTFTATHLYAFWASAPAEPDSPWPMWRHDAQRTGWAR
jgi:outer membrane protein assembly factor BamB